MAAGLCDLPELIRRTRADWDEADSFMDPAHTHSGFMGWEQPICSFLKPGGRIGVIGCGSGRDLLALARRGYTVEGLDTSARALRLAQQYLTQAGISATLHQGDAAEFVFPSPRYDAFVFSWFTYSYLPTAHRRIQALRNLRQRLDPDGCVVIVYIPYAREGRLFIRLARAVAALARNPHPPVLGDVFTVSLSYEHRFTPEEFAAEARAAQFVVATSWQDAEVAIAVLQQEVHRP